MMAVKEQALQSGAGKLQQVLNEQLANWAVLYVKLHHHHWYVKGPHFETLHAKFEELYNMAASNMDELAERMLAIGLKPASAMKDYLALASIREAEQQSASDQDMLASTVNDFTTIATGLKTAIQLAEGEQDTATADILIGYLQELEKQMWMLNAMMGK